MNWKGFWKDLGFTEGFVLGAALTGFLLFGCWLWANIADVRLLDAMTAFGTVGAVMVAVFLATRNESKESRKDAADGALAVFSEKDRIIRIRRTILECANDLKDGGKGGVHGKELCVWIEETSTALEATLHPKYAAFDRAFIRRLLDAKSKLDEAEWLLLIGLDSDPDTLVLLQEAAQELEAAEEICISAKQRMEAWWA